MTYEERIRLAKVAYSAYGDTAEWKNFRGEPMPQWDGLSERTKTCWIMAASAVYNNVLEPK